MAALKRNAAVKIEMQYGKLITDARFEKSPKRKACFRTVATALCESAVFLHRSFAT